MTADPLIEEFALYLNAELKRLPRTVHEYTRDLEIFGSYLADRKPLNPDGSPFRGPFGSVFVEATPTATRRFIVHLSSLNYSATAIRRKLAVLRRFFSYLKRERLRADNPAADIANIRLPKRLPKAIAFDDVMKLIGTPPPAGQSEDVRRRDVAMLELLYASGVRRAELVGMNVGDVDFERKTIRVTGKGNKQRTVFFNDATAAALDAYLRVRPASPDGALFVSRRRQRLSYQQVGRVFSLYVKLSGLEGKISPHTMRHSVATHLHQSGVDLMTIKEFLGHESIQTTQIYAEMSMDHVRRSYDLHHLRDKV
jgi:integrase/recombinase XerC